jgi:hypothetical protein
MCYHPGTIFTVSRILKSFILRSYVYGFALIFCRSFIVNGNMQTKFLEKLLELVYLISF